MEVNCETDFAARGADFQQLVREIVSHVTATPVQGVDALLEQRLHGGGDKNGP